ncbi:MAG: histidine phosphatase family protein [Chloroflexota bacterium]
MELLLMRHAKSDWEQGVSDFDRPLNDRGEEAAEKMGELLKELDLVPNFIICSSAQRARDTAEGVIDGSDYEGRIYHSDRLYLCDISDFIRVIREQGGEHQRVLVIAHNPGTEGFISYLTNEMKRVTTANIGLIDLPIESWQQLDATVRGELKGFWRPREPRF